MTILLTTVHDPEGKMLPATRRVLAELSSLYAGFVVEATDCTSPRLMRLLSNVAYIHTNPPGDIAQARRTLIRCGLSYFPRSHFHFADYDRLLHWWLHYPDELREMVAKMPGHRFTVFGRTRRAFGTHPFIQRETERVVNTAFGMDVLTASRGLCYEAAFLIRDNSRACGPAGVDVEWPILAREYWPLNYVEVDGLEYESDTFGLRRRPADEMRLRLKNMWQGLKVVYG